MGRRSEVRRMIESRLESWYGLEPLEQRCLATVAPGAEFLVNTWTADVQNANPAGAIAADDAGNFVTVWESLNRDAAGSYGIYGQRSMADGTPLGSEFLVNTTMLGDQRMPSVSMNGSGAFVVAWEGQGSLGSFAGIYVQRYDAAGAPLGSEIAVAGTSLLSVNEVAVTMNANGEFILVWEENGPNGRDIAARIYDANGSPIGAAFTVNQTTTGNQRQPQVVMDSAGNFAVTWNGNGIGDDAGVFSRLFGATGMPFAGEVLVNTTTTGTQSFSAIARDGTGQFLVVWSGNGAGDTAGVFARRMTSAGMPTGSEFQVNSTTTGTQQRPSVAFDADGEYVVAWSGFGAADTSGIYGREFWSDDAPKAAEFPLNTTTSLIQINASVASTGDNRYAAVWNGPGAGDSAGVFGRLMVNIAPVLATTGGSVDYIEDGAPVVIDAGLIVSDADSMIASATVRIIGGNVAGEDSLVFVNQLGIAGSWNSVTGLLTLTGNAPVPNYEAALRSVAYVNVSQNPSAAARTIVFALSDGSLGSTAPANGVAVTPVNDAPTVTPSGLLASFVEDRGPVAVDPGLMVNDVDSAMLTEATVQISDNYAAAEDSLEFTDQLGITGSWNPVTGLLTLTGVATAANYQAALRSVRFMNSSQDPAMLTRTVVFIVSDGAIPGNAASCSVEVLGANEAPVVSASGGSVVYTEDAAPVVIAPGLGVSDADSATLASAMLAITGNYRAGEDSLVFTNQAGIAGSWDAIAGVLTLSGMATVGQYEAALRSVGYVNASQNPSGFMRSVTISVSDGVDASESVSQTVSVTPVNDAPGAVASSGRATYTEGSAAVAVDDGVTLNDVDSAMLSSAVVQISGNFAAGEDSLVFTAQAGITGVWQASSGTLTLSGAASVAAYQAALRTVRYLNSSSDPSTAERTVTMVVLDDAGAAGVAVSRAISVVAVPPPIEPPIEPPTSPGHPRPPAHPPSSQRDEHRPPWAGHGHKVRFDFPRGHWADATVMMVDERHADRDGGSRCMIVVELPNGSRRDEMCIWTSVHSSAHSSNESRHEERGNGGRDSDLAEAKGRSGAEDRGNGAKGRGK